MALRTCFSRLGLGLAAALAAVHANAQVALEAVTVTGKSDPVIDIGGWGDVPLSRAPFQASIIGTEQMRDRGVQRLGDVVRIDPAVSDGYNAEGYWDFLTIRGFVIDNRFNYRRDGLPISAETSIPLDNKQRIELLKGTSGLQAGTSAPGGLVNLVVKRPTAEPLRDAQLAWRAPGSLLGSLDISQRFGESRAFGLRVNAAAQRLDSYTRNLEGERRLLAVAGDWRIGSDTLLEAEFETSHRSQPSVPGFSVLGTAVPAPVDQRINLNNQPWSLPVVLDANTASVRLSQRLAADWRYSVHAATQRLKSDDRIAFPFGCTAESNLDRYCSDGTFDLYDFRSENERRRSDSLEVAVHGALLTGQLAHAVSAGILRSKVRNRFQRLAFNFVGTGSVDGTLLTPADPMLTGDNSNRDERSTEFFARDQIRFNATTTAWLGLRHTRLSRGSIDTSGVAGPSFSQNITTPWLALSHELTPQRLIYASWGQGIESVATPNLPSYGSAAGQALPSLKSRQFEVGIKVGSAQRTWSLALFDIDRPVARDTGTTFFIDGSARHRGMEASGAWQFARWIVQGGIQVLRARREGSQDTALNAKRPTNVPAATLKLQARRGVESVPGLSVQTDLLAESNRVALPDNSARIPGYGRVDTGLRYVQPRDGGTLTWRAGVDNVFDKRAWRESPFQFGHAYLYPLPRRTLRVSLQADF